MTAASSLKGREILLGVSGGIAAYKSADLTSKLVQAGASVSVVLTRAARKFIGKTTFEALTNRPVHTRLFSPQEHPLDLRAVEEVATERAAETQIVLDERVPRIDHHDGGGVGR